MTSRIWTKFPNRKPLEFGVGLFRRSWIIAVSVPGFTAERDARTTIIGTGGLAPLFAETEDLFDVIEEDLTMHGLRLIHDYNKEMGNG